MAPEPPEVSSAVLDAGGWEQTDETVETVFELPTNRIQAATRRYEDEHTRAALGEAVGLDRTVRFFAATRLTFEPPPPPGVTPGLAASTLRTEVRQEFTDRLRDRGLQDIEKGDSQRVRVADNRRARLTKYTATDPLVGEGDTATGRQSLPLECWVAVWTRSKTARVVTGGHPTVTLASWFGVDATGPLARPSEEFRDEFLDLLRAVE